MTLIGTLKRNKMKRLYIVLVVLSMLVESVYAQTEGGQIKYTKTASMIDKQKSGLKSLDLEDASYWRILVSYSGMSREESSGSRISDAGVRAGFLKGVSLSSVSPIYFEWGIDGTYETYMEDDWDKDYFEENLFYITVPAQLSARMGNSKVSLQPFAGLHAKYHIIGHLYTDDAMFDAKNYYDSSDLNGVEYNRFQVGLQLGVGLNMKVFYIGYEFRHDITSWRKGGDVKTSTHLATLGINF